MRKQWPLILLVMLVALPLAALVLLGDQLARQASERTQSRMQDAFASRLHELSVQVDDVVTRVERAVIPLTEVGAGHPDVVRRALWRSRYARAVAVIDPRGERVYPPAEQATQAETDFLERSRSVWASGALFGSNGEGGVVSHGWHTWFWGKGLNLLFWVRQDDGVVVAVDINPSALLAEVISVLPDSRPETTMGGSYRVRAARAVDIPQDPIRMSLQGSRGEMLYQWGAYAPGTNAVPFVSIALAPPLGSWRLNCFVAPALRGRMSSGISLALAAGLAAVGLLMVTLAVVLYRAHTRAMHDAAQRVSFVNQVSHELKTPLTNIRMYAELLEPHVADDPRAARFVEVVVSESRRLSRMIANVLSFARQRRGALKLRPSSVVPDEIITTVIEHFAPAFASCNIELICRLNATRPVSCDKDVVEQIVGNLLSNAEKYAGSGAGVVVETQLFEDWLQLDVSDNGPGIPRARRQAVFKPFVRLSDRLTEGASGTGIGLSIVRELAALHGGSVELVPSERGAHFRVRLKMMEVSDARIDS